MASASFFFFNHYCVEKFIKFDLERPLNGHSHQWLVYNLWKFAIALELNFIDKNQSQSPDERSTEARDGNFHTDGKYARLGGR